MCGSEQIAGKSTTINEGGIAFTLGWGLPTMKPEGNNNASKANNSASEAAEKCCPEEGTTCCCEPEVEEKLPFDRLSIWQNITAGGVSCCNQKRFISLWSLPSCPKQFAFQIKTARSTMISLMHSCPTTPFTGSKLDSL